MTVKKRIVSAAITLLGLIGVGISAGMLSAAIDPHHTTQSEYSDIKHSEPKDQNVEIIVELTDQKKIAVDSQDDIVVITPKAVKMKIEPKKVKKKVIPKVSKEEVKPDGTEYKVEVTAYTASKRECGKKNGKTASGGKVIPNETCSVSRDLKKAMFKKYIHVPGKGLLYVNDTMRKGIKRSIDIAMSSRDSADEFGRKKLVVVLRD